MKKLKLKFNSLPIKWKVFIYLSSFCCTLLLLMWMMQVVFLDDIYKTIRERQMVSAVEKIENVIYTGGTGTDVNRIAEESDACVMVLAANGTKVHSVDVLRDCELHRMPYVDILNIVIRTKESGGRLKAVYSKNRPFQPDMLIENPDYNHPKDVPLSMVYCKQLHGEDGGYIIVNIRLSPVNATVTAIESSIRFITIIMLLFSAVVAHIMSRNIAHPIEYLSGQVCELATGDYETVFNATGSSEINQLSKALNHTAEELGRVENLRREFIANVSHDLRTPLTLIGGYAEIMRDIPGENNAENAGYIIDETKRLSSLVNDLLDISRIQSGAVPMQKQQFDLTQSMEKTIVNMQQLLKQDGYSISFDCPGPVIVNADQVRINQCFYNILINAVNYTGQDKNIYVELTSGEGTARISVTDTGDGVDEKDISNVWQRYYKSNKNHRRSVTGTGIGLSIVQSVIKAHSGKCGVYNTADKGACFWFEIPIE